MRLWWPGHDSPLAPCARGRVAGTRRVIVGVLVLVVAGVVGSALTSSRRSPRPPRRSPALASRSVSTGPRQSALSVPPLELARARQAAARFMERFLPFLYGTASPASVAPATSGLRRELTRDRVAVTPVERRRHPRVVSVETAGQALDVVMATTLIEDGGVASYALRITLRHERFGWVVSAVNGG